MAHTVTFLVVFGDLWLRFGTGGRTRSVKTYDSGSGDTVLPSTRDSDGSTPLFSSSWCLECWVYFWRTVGKTYSLPGTKSCSAGEFCVVLCCVCAITYWRPGTGTLILLHGRTKLVDFACIVSQNSASILRLCIAV